MSFNLSFREATGADVPLLRQLAGQTWEPTYCSILSKEQIDYMYELIYREEALLEQMAEGQVFLLLFDADQATGFASYSLKDESKNLFKLNKIYLLPGAQGKGAGRKLLAVVEQEVTKQGAKAIELNVNRHNPARKFYEACGYTIAREEDIPVGPYWMNDYVMQKSF